MPKIVTQSNNAEYNVTTKQLFDDKGNFSGIYGNFREDKKEAIGFCTERYTLVQNADLFDTVEKALGSKKELKNPEISTIVVGDGERAYRTYTWKNSSYNFRVGKPKVGDEVGLRLTVQNSFDRSLRLSVILGFLRLVCSNGMTALSQEFDLTQRHQSGLDMSRISTGIDDSLASIEAQKAIYNRLAATTLTDEQGVSVLGNLTKKNILSSSMKDSIEAIWRSPSYDEDKERNLYNLYNAGTQHLTRVIAPKRYELAQRIGNDMLKAFDRAADNKKNLDALMLVAKN